MRLLLTRPETEVQRTAAALRAQGHHVIIAPLLRIAPVADAQIGAGPWAAILTTSANAAHAIAAHASVTPLRTLPVMLAYIRGTTTETGLVVRARSLRKTYKTKLKVSARQMASLNLERHAVCPNWNYTIRPRPQLRQAS